VINGLDIPQQSGSVVVQAGTAVDPSGQVISAGGRVLAVVGTGDDLAEARSQAYASIGKLELDGAFYRRDIAEQAARIPARQGQGA
jgi:phosphoribosylamine--glycine ligase